jgi:hypothetical protein
LLTKSKLILTIRMEYSFITFFVCFNIKIHLVLAFFNNLLP